MSFLDSIKSFFSSKGKVEDTPLAKVAIYRRDLLDYKAIVETPSGNQSFVCVRADADFGTALSTIKSEVVSRYGYDDFILYVARSRQEAEQFINVRNK